MITLDVTTNDQSGIAGTLAGVRTQMPFALSVAINNTLDDAQAAIRSALPSSFVLRAAEFINRTIYIAPADRARKDRLVGAVRVNPARDFLAKFEAGGEKTPQSGKSLAVPVFREDNKTIVIKRSDPLSVQQLFKSIQERAGQLKRQRRPKGSAPIAAAGQSSVYLVTNAKGTYIVQRTGSTTRVLYAFEHAVPIKPQLHFEEIAMRTALARWDTNVSEAIAYALATAK